LVEFLGGIAVNNQGQLLTPFQRKLLLKHLKIERRSEYRRRIEIMLAADAGQTQAEICASLKCSQKTVRYWMSMARAGMAHQWNDCPIGRPQIVNDQYLNRLRELVSNSPRAVGYPFKRWTAQVLSKHLANEFGIEVGDRHINRLLKKMGLSTRSSSVEAAIKTTEPTKTKDFEISICDLQPASVSDLLLPLNFIQTNN
jgi:transposase